MAHRHEQRIDLIVQGAGLVASLAGLALLVTLAAGLPTSRGDVDAVALAATLTYGLTLVAMFACSMLNTAVRHPRWQGVCRVLDHAFIYCLIAGTYTPFCLLGIGGRRGVELLLGVWLAALLGVIIRVAFHRRLKSAIVTFYILLGWAGVIHLDDFLHRLTATAVALLAVGGIVYTVAAPVHRWSQLRYHSAIWHGCVVVAAACHYAAVWLLIVHLNAPAAA